MLKSVLENIAKTGRRVKDKSSLSSLQIEKLSFLREHGYVLFDQLVGTEQFERIKADYIYRLEKGLEFKTPCLAQNKIDLQKHKALIENNFLASASELRELGLTFEKSDIQSYSQVLSDFAPSTLTMSVPNEIQYFDLWLDDNMITVAENYMGFTPQLTEAYIRRNFPAKVPVMNHYWHRDRNHPKNLLKAFIFFSDCTLKTGPHHYISGSIDDQTFSGKNYYTDEEVAAVYPENSGKQIVSVVPAGTIILEDTRGLHKAGVPDESYRDLGFAVFLPPVAFKPFTPLYSVDKTTFDQLSDHQKKFIPLNNVA